MIADPVTSLHNVRIGLGEARLTGNVRYTAPEEPARGRLEAQVAMQGLDLAELPQMAALFEPPATSTSASSSTRAASATAADGAGRIVARVLSDGPELVVESARDFDLAGANARVSGRIGPDGSGRIAGKVTAKRAAPLVDLVGRVWVGGVSRLVPRFLREGELDLDIVAERTAGPQGASDPLPLKTTARGDRRGWAVRGGRALGRGANRKPGLAACNRQHRPVGRQARRPLLRRPSNLDLKGVRVPPGSSTSRS